MSNLDLLKIVRYKTGLSFKDINKAIETLKTDNVDEIVKYLREQGVLKQQSREGREVSNGKIFSYVHEGRIGVLLEIKSETDFVSRSPEFQQMGENVLLHIAAYQPKFVSEKDVNQDWLNSEIEIARELLTQEGKSPEIISTILAGKKDKIIKEFCLLTQPFIKNPDITVAEYMLQACGSTGEKIELTRFVIFNLNS